MERRWVRVTIKIIYAGNYLNRPYLIIFFNTNLNQQSCYVSEVHITNFFLFWLGNSLIFDAYVSLSSKDQAKGTAIGD